MDLSEVAFEACGRFRPGACQTVLDLQPIMHRQAARLKQAESLGFGKLRVKHRY